MNPGAARFLALAGLAALLAGCETPLEPNQHGASVESRGGPPVTNDARAVVISATRIDILWTDNASNEAGWEINRSTTGRDGTYSLLVSTGPNATGYADEGLAYLTEFCYRVRSFKITGRKKSFAAFTIPACATTLGPPPAASNIVAMPAYSSAVQVTWADNSETEGGFRLERSQVSTGPWVAITTTGPNAVSYTDFGRTSEEEVCYRVFALSFGAESAPSNTACTTPPAPATTLRAKSLDGENIDLTWTDNSAVEDGYEVRRWNGTDWEIVASLPENTISYRDVVSAGAIPYYTVLAMKDGGHSDFSNISTISPRAPGSVQAIPAGSTTVWVYWSDMSGNAEGFRIERSKDAGLTWEAVFDGRPEEGLAWGFEEESERQVCYRVFAYNSEGSSQPSETDCTVPPAAPTLLVPIRIDEHTVEHRWRDNSVFEDGYELWLIGSDEWGNSYYYPVSLPLDTKSYQASASEGLYGIIARKDGGYSDWAFPEIAAAAVERQSRTVRRAPGSAQRTPPKLPVQQGVSP